MRFKSLVVALILCSLLDGCHSKKSLTEVEQANKTGLLLVGIGPDPEGFDPQLISGVTEQNILRALFEGLVSPDLQSLEAKPGVAERWEVNDCKYTFHLRTNARWSNGDPLTAQDFIFTFKRLLTPQLAAPNASNLFIIKNAQQFYKQQVPFDEVGIKALDDYTLEITLEYPAPYFLSILMLPMCYPLHEGNLTQNHCTFSRNQTWTRSAHMVSNGPFVLQEWVVGKKIEVSKNKYYWNANQVRLNSIHFIPIADVITEERAFRCGQLHITENVPYQKFKTYYQNGDSNLRIHPYCGTFYYLLNTSVYPLNDVRVRRALSMAIDRDSLMGNDQLALKHHSTYQLIPEGCAGFHSISPIKENAELARQLLAEAGFPNGQNFPKLTLLFNTTEGQIYLASALQEMWKKQLNIHVELVNQEWKVYLQMRREGHFEIARGGWVGDYNDPSTFLNLWRSDASNNFGHWGNSNFDELLEKAKTSITSQRMQYLQEAEKILLEESPFIPLHSSASTHLVHSSVHNWFGNLLDWHPYDCIYLQ